MWVGGGFQLTLPTNMAYMRIPRTTSQQYDHRGTQQVGGGGRYVCVWGGGGGSSLPYRPTWRT